VIAVAAQRRGRRAGVAVAAVAALTLIANLGWIATHLDWLRPLEPGHPAPSFDLPVLGPGGQPTGQRVTRDGLRGKVVVLEFWATWCGPCLASLPLLDRAARGWGDRVAAIAVNLDDRGKAAAVFADHGWQLILAGDAGDCSARYQVDMLPHAVVIDQAGVVRLMARGRGAAGRVERAVAALLAEP